MRTAIYSQISKLFRLDGEDKNGLYFTVDGVQYNIKVTKKIKPVSFEKREGLEEVAEKLKEPINAAALERIIKSFGEGVQKINV